MYNELIIIRFPSKQVSSALKDLNVQKKNFKLIYWHKNKWLTEEKELIDSTNKIKTLTYLITSWLNLLHEEKILDKVISVESVMFDQPQTEAFISFDYNFLPKAFSTQQKWYLVEGLLKTIRDNGFALKSLRLLVRNKQLQDTQLDFSHPWPLTGFVSA